MLKNLKIGSRLLWSFSFVLLFLIAIMLYGIYNLQVVNDNVQLLVNDRLVKSEWAHRLVDEVGKISTSYRDMFIEELTNNDSSSNKKFFEEKMKIIEESRKNIDLYSDSIDIKIFKPKARELFNESLIIRKKFREDTDRLLEFINKGDIQASNNILTHDLKESRTAYVNKNNEFLVFLVNEVHDQGKDSVVVVNTGTIVLIIIGVISIIFAIFIALWITKSIARPIKQAVEAAECISKGKMEVNLQTDSKDETGLLLQSMQVMADTIKKLVNELNVLGASAVEGRLDHRGNETLFEGEYRNIVRGFNDTLNAVIGPLNVAAEYVDRIAKGDIPPKVKDNFKGDFNEIKNNLNQCIDSLNGLIGEMMSTTKLQKEGDIEAFAQTDKFQGIYRELVAGYNEGMQIHINNILDIINSLNNYSQGDLSKEMRVLPGKQIILTNTINSLRLNVINLITDANMLAGSTVEGKLKTRVDATHHQGDFRKIVEGINNMLNSVVSPIDEISTVMSVFATGDLTHRIISEYKGDFAKLQNDVNHFADSLSDLILKITDSVQNTASAAHEISSTAESLAAASQEQSAQADEVANAVEAMSRTIAENAMSASRTAEVGNQNSTMAYESGKVVEQTVDKMRKIAEVVKESAKNIEQLGESSKQIGEIISVIDDIADQTNLLALNAAIEAARAGEQGRGFAVVADEVRKLAERTTDATKQIAQMIKGIQNETEHAVIAMNKGTLEVQSGIDLADKAGESLKQILNSTQEVLDMVNQIASASEEQSATSDEISKNVLAISKVTADSTMRVEEVARTADELAQLTEQLRDLVMTFKVDNSSYNFNRSNHHLLGMQHTKQLGY